MARNKETFKMTKKLSKLYDIEDMSIEDEIDFKLWIVKDIDKLLKEMLLKIACFIGIRNNYDMAEVLEIAEEMTEEVKKGIQDVISKYDG